MRRNRVLAATGALTGVLGALAAISTPATAQLPGFLGGRVAPAPAKQEYVVQFGAILSVLPSTSDPLGINRAIAAAFPFPVVGYIADSAGNMTALTSEKVVAQLRTYKAMQEAAGKPVSLVEFMRIAHLAEPKTVEAAFIEAGKNMIGQNTIANVMYGGQRPPDSLYITYDGASGPQQATHCSLPLLRCGKNAHYSMREGTFKSLFREQGSGGITDRRMVYYLWDYNPLINDTRLGSFEVNTPEEAGKGWNTVAVEGGTATGSSVYLVEYCVVKKGDSCPVAPTRD